MRTDSSPSRTIAGICVALAIHAMLFTLSGRMKSSSTDSSPKQESVKVKFLPTQQPSQQALASANSKLRSGKKAKSQPRPQVLTSKQDPLDTREQPTVVVEPPDSAAQSNPILRTQKSALIEERESVLLPSSKSTFMEGQRKLGEVIGAGAIAGDLEVPDVVSEQDVDGVVRRTEYTFAGYFDSLSRRFVEAWGGVRTLPPNARFDGKIGEFIEYDVVINRDGSLRKIINFTSKKQPFRDFSAVDELVTEVFQAMFPFNPVPERIQNDPLVIRKRIQFVGFKYTLY